MSDYFLNYAVSNVFGIIIFGIILIHDRASIDKQEKQLKFDYALIAFILYFLFDVIWAALDSGLIPTNLWISIVINFAMYICMVGITYTWLQYGMAFELIPRRNNKKFKLAILLPFIISTVIMIIVFIINPYILLDKNLKTTSLYNVFLVFVPYLYIVVTIIYALRKVKNEKSGIEKRKHIYVAFFPIMVVIGGFVQMTFVPQLPVFCYSSSILMLIFYIQSMENQISTDPLTKLNNRTQLEKYVAQINSVQREGKRTYVVMIDINDFKLINDNYGHAEGDLALIIISQTIKTIISSNSIPIFASRYGGDEFILIIHTSDENDINKIVSDFRTLLARKCKLENKPYILSAGVGVDELFENDIFENCIKRADDKLYENKKNMKKSVI